MKHPLTSKERRGLVAVAAAALLCIASGFIFRSCSDMMAAKKESASAGSEKCDSCSYKENNTSSGVEGKPDNTNNKNSSNKTNKTKKSKKSYKSNKTYPTRDPLSQPCD